MTETSENSWIRIILTNKLKLSVTNKLTNYGKGFGLVEVVVGLAIISIGFVSLLGVFNFFMRNSLGSVKRVQAMSYLESGLEIAKIWRDTSWTNTIATFTPATTYYFNWTGSNWVSTLTPNTIDDIFTWTLVADSVYRDGTSHDIVTEGGALDAGTKKITVSISWMDSGAVSTRSLSAYLSHVYSN